MTETQYSPIKLPIIKDVEANFISQKIALENNLNPLEKSMLQSIMTTALNYTFEHQKIGKFNDDFTLHDQLNINYHLSIGLVKELRKIVGVQPMKGPVDLIKLMQFEKNENNYFTLALYDHTVEARTARYAARIERNTMLTDDRQLTTRDKHNKLIKEMQTEIISNVLQDLINLCKHTEIKYKITKEMFESDKTYPSYIFELNKASNRVACCSRRGYGNRMIVPEKMFRKLCKCENFKYEQPEKVHVEFKEHELTYVGKYRNGIDVYVSPLLTDKIIIGYVGSAHTNTVDDPDVGYVYSPYVPAVYSGLIINPIDLEPVDAFMKQYGKFVRSKSENTLSSSADYYSVIDVEFPEETITAKTHKLSANWSIDNADVDDLEYFYNKRWRELRLPENSSNFDEEKFKRLSKLMENTANEIKRLSTQQPFTYSGNWLVDDTFDDISKVNIVLPEVSVEVVDISDSIDYTKLFDTQPMIEQTGQIFIMKPKYYSTTINDIIDSQNMSGEVAICENVPEKSSPKKKNILKRLFD